MSRNVRKAHVSMRGLHIDVDAIRAQQEESIAIGNAKMNARGDILSGGGKIEIRREQIIRDFYAKHPSGVKAVSLKAATPDVFETPSQAMSRMVDIANTELPVVDDAVMDTPPQLADKKTRKLVDKGD